MEASTLPDNYELRFKRLQGLLRCLRECPAVKYDAIIQNQLRQGVVEEVKKPDNPVKCKLHYLPHHAIIRTDKETTKIRIVYDVSAKSSGCSFNDCLHVGPEDLRHPPSVSILHYDPCSPCGITRAIHLDILPGLTTFAFI